MFRYLIFSLLMIFSCKNFAQENQVLELLSAEKSFWFGGRAHVRGENMVIKFKQPVNKSIIFEKLVLDNIELPVASNFEKDVVTLSSAWQTNPEMIINEDGKKSVPVNQLPDHGILYYKFKGSNKQYTFEIKKFKTIRLKPSGLEPM